MIELTTIFIERAVVLEEQLQKLIDKIKELEDNSKIIFIDGFMYQSIEYLNILYQRLELTLKEQEEVQVYFENLDCDILYQTYEYLAEKPKDDLKISMLCYLFKLIDMKESKERGK